MRTYADLDKLIPRPVKKKPAPKRTPEEYYQYRLDYNRKAYLKRKKIKEGKDGRKA